jgi:leucyl aminopeptidase
MIEMPRLAVVPRDSVAPDLLVVGCCAGDEPDRDGLAAAPAAAIGRLAARAGWEGRDKQRLETEAADGGPMVSLQGLGKGEELTDRKAAEWLTRLVEEAETNGCARLAVILPDHPQFTGEGAAERAQRVLLLAGYRFDRYRANGDRPPTRVQEVALLPPAAATEAYRDAIPAAVAVAAGATFCRDLANSPANEATPDWMEAQARELAARAGMRATVLDEAELRRRGMGGLLAMGAGSPQRPRLVRLDWAGDGDGPVVALVGKGVTFDTGGISIKPAADMDEMKYDKCGACTVLGIARAVADLGLPVRLRVYLPLVENMPDGAACRPGDIVRCYNGKTVEILNTDAEGRMILADALAWAAEEGPDALLEYSTLTGASVVALGHRVGAVYTPDDVLAGGLLGAAARAGERLWRMPMWPEYVDQMRGHHADLKNVAGRWGGANTAAAFLSQFVGDLARWAHFDIAGAAYVGNDEDEPKGATGYGVHLSVDWLRRLAG